MAERPGRGGTTDTSGFLGGLEPLNNQAAILLPRIASLGYSHSIVPGGLLV
jgi:hypothetical protein